MPSQASPVPVHRLAVLAVQTRAQARLGMVATRR